VAAQSGLGFSGIVAIQIPDDGAPGEVLTKVTADDYDYDWAAGGGGGGGQVNTVVGGANISVNAGDPVNPIINLDAAILGVSVNGVTLNAVGVVTNFLDETGNYSIPPDTGGVVTSMTLTGLLSTILNVFQDAGVSPVSIDLSAALGLSSLQTLYTVAPTVPQFSVNAGQPITIDLSVAVNDVFALRNAANADLFRVSDTLITVSDVPVTMLNTLSPAAFNIIANDTFTTGGGFNGGVIDSVGTITYDNAFFIWGLMVERKLYRGDANPGFAAFTLFNALPTIENEGNFDLVSALVLNVGVAHSRRTAGTSNVLFTNGLSFSPQLRATVAGAIMSRTTGVIAVSVSPTFSTVFGSTVNLGTIIGMQFSQPSVGLFQPGAGTENMTAYLGIAFPDMTFGGVNRVIEVIRSQLNAATNVRFISHTGTAQSDFGGRVNLNGVLAHASANLGFYGTAPIAQPAAVPVTAAGIHAALVSLGLIT